jgi:hypothetical protein
MKSMKLREQAGAGQGLPKSEFAHASRVASGRLGGSLPGSEVDYSGVLRSIFPAEVSMLWGHVASCRLTRPRRSRISRASVDLRHRLCRTRDPP